jgi:hypothetical protein
MIAYPLRQARVVGIATVPTSSYFDPPDDFSLWHAMFAGTISTFDDPILPAAATCSTDNCTFPRYTSIGTCATAVNITSHLNITAIPNSSNADWLLSGLEWFDC